MIIPVPMQSLRPTERKHAREVVGRTGSSTLPTGAMPVYDCGDAECTECQRAFGPDRSKAIANYERRAAYYATLERGTLGPTGGRQDAGGGVREAEKVRELATSIPAEGRTP